MAFATTCAVSPSSGKLSSPCPERRRSAAFSPATVREMIYTVRQVCGEDVEITLDTPDTHYWNYKIDPQKLDKSWGDSVWTDFSDFSEEALKMCVEIFDEVKAK